MGDQFSAAGYGVTSVGWGERPAIVAVDFQLAFCDPAFATGRSDHIASAVAKCRGVLIAGRAAGIPIVHTAVAWSHDDEFTNWKVPSLRDITPDSLRHQLSRSCGGLGHLPAQAVSVSILRYAP